MHTENACRTSVICNIISASTMTAMRESTPRGREGGRETACLSKRGTFFFFFLVLIRKYNEPLKKRGEKKGSLLRLMENKLIWWFGFNYYFSISPPCKDRDSRQEARSCACIYWFLPRHKQGIQIHLRSSPRKPLCGIPLTQGACSSSAMFNLNTINRP